MEVGILMEKLKGIMGNSTFWEAISALGTLLAVVVSLCLANRKVKPHRELKVKSVVTTHYSGETVDVAVTLDNIGNRPIIIVECGVIKKRKHSNDIVTVYNKYLTPSFEPRTIRAGDAFMLEYKIGIEDFVKFKNKSNAEIGIMVMKWPFGVRDSLNDVYTIDGKVEYNFEI